MSRLALVDSVAFSGWPSRDVRLARALLRLTRRVAPRWLLGVLRADLERGYEDSARAVHSIDRFIRPFASEEGRNAFMQHLRALDAGETRALAERLGEIAVPTAVIWGAHDSFLPVKLGRRLAAAIPGATLDGRAAARVTSSRGRAAAAADAIAALLPRLLTRASRVAVLSARAGRSRSCALRSALAEDRSAASVYRLPGFHSIQLTHAVVVARPASARAHASAP